MDWQAFIFNPSENWIYRLEHVCRKRFFDDLLAEEAFVWAFERLQKDNFSRLTRFQGKSSPSTFLIAVFRNLVEDFAISRFGKCRAPVWVQRMGDLWQQLFKKLCCEHREPNAIVEMYASESAVENDILSICQTIKARHAKCGHKVSEVSIDDERGGQLLAGHQTKALENALEHESFNEVLLALNQWLATDIPNHESHAIHKALQGLDVAVESMLLMRLVYQEGMAVANAAAELGIKAHAARRQLKQVLSVLADTLAAFK